MTYYIGDASFNPSDELRHFGTLGMKWGVRKYQNKDGTLTEAGRERYRKINRAVNALRADRDFKYTNGTREDYDKVQREKEAAMDKVIPKKMGYMDRNELISTLQRNLDIDPDSKYYQKSKQIINKWAGFDYDKAVEAMEREQEAKEIVKDFVRDVKYVFGKEG